MFARQRDPAIDLAKIVVVLASRLIRPIAGAAEREGHAVSRDRHAVFEPPAILRMNLRAVIDRALDPLRR